MLQGTLRYQKAEFLAILNMQMHTNTCIGTYVSMNMHISAYMFVICKQNFILSRAMMSLKNLRSFQGHHVQLIGYICTISSVYEKLVCACLMRLAYDRI